MKASRAEIIDYIRRRTAALYSAEECGRIARMTAAALSGDAEAKFLADKIFVMSARPGRVLAEHRVPFARPRQLDIMYDKGFNDMVQELHGEIAQARVAA